MDPRKLKVSNGTVCKNVLSREEEWWSVADLLFENGSQSVKTFYGENGNNGWPSVWYRGTVSTFVLWREGEWWQSFYLILEHSLYRRFIEKREWWLTFCLIQGNSLYRSFMERRWMVAELLFDTGNSLYRRFTERGELVAEYLFDTGAQSLRKFYGERGKWWQCMCLTPESLFRPFMGRGDIAALLFEIFWQLFDIWSLRQT